MAPTWPFFEERYGGPVLQAAAKKSPPRAKHAADWRRIDDDWLGFAGPLALQLDSYTNNTSLVLAFELVRSRKVLLFVGDAQVGNWLSWHDKPLQVDGRAVTATDLLKRTVFCKVGHHGSHNATLKDKGLELMTSDERIAFVPVEEKIAHEKKGWKEMPKNSLMKRLGELTAGRLLQSDEVAAGKDPRITFIDGDPSYYKVLFSDTP
ncbi:MAG: hypothetical protein U1D55_16685 [Phycisphaerae bacterium]